jgi:hypothetical protein
MKIIIVNVFIFCLFFAVVCDAQNYIALELGAVHPTHTINDGGLNYRPGDGYNIGVKYSKYFDNNLGFTVIASNSAFKTNEQKNWYLNNSGPFKDYFEFNIFTYALGLAFKEPLNNSVTLIADTGTVYHINQTKYFISGSEKNYTSSVLGLFIDFGAKVHLKKTLFGTTARYVTNNQKTTYTNINLSGLSILLFSETRF